MTKNLLISLSFVIIYNLLFYQKGLGLGFGLLILLLNITFYLFKDKDSKNESLGIISSMGAIFFAFLTAYRANEPVSVINALTSLFLSASALFLNKDLNRFKYLIPNFLISPLLLVISAITSIPNYLESKKNENQKIPSEVSGSLLRGLAFSAPVLIILTVLLINADPVFNKLVGGLFSNIQERVLISAIIFVPLFCLSFVKIKEAVAKPEQPKELTAKGYELAVILGGIAILFGVFIAVQFQYLFSGIGERELSQLGIKSLTYSEYVRKGFFELLIASVISGGVLVYVLRYIKSLKSQEKILVQVFSSALIAETILILLSAAQRVNLYQMGHGLTRARIFGFTFLVYLAAVLLIFLIHIFKNMTNKQFFVTQTILTVLMLASLSFINIDGLIAEKYRPTVNGEIDYLYLATLSPDASDSWNEIISTSEALANELESKKEGYTGNDLRHLIYAAGSIRSLDSKVKHLKNNTRWQSFNISNSSAQMLISQNKESYYKLTELGDRLVNLQNKIAKQGVTTTLDRDTSPPLVK